MTADASAPGGIIMHMLPITWHENSVAITVAASMRGTWLVVDCMLMSIDDARRFIKAAPPSASSTIYLGT